MSYSPTEYKLLPSWKCIPGFPFLANLPSLHLPLTVGAADEQMLPWEKPQLIILIFI